MKPACFDLLDFTARYHQTPLDPASRVLTAFRAAGVLYQWTRVAMGLKGASLYFKCSMQNKVLNGLVYEICEIYIDDVLLHGKFKAEFLRTSFTPEKRLKVPQPTTQGNASIHRPRELLSRLCSQT